MDKNRNFQDEIRIDTEALDVEWAEQSELFCDWASELAEANKEVNRLEQKDKVTRSKLTLEANRNPSVMGKDVKATGTNVEAYFRTHPEHTKVKEELIEATYNRDLLIGAVGAFRQRKDALEKLVVLHGQSYFSGPVEPRNLTSELIKKKEKREKGTKVKRGNAKELPEEVEETEKEMKMRLRRERKERRGNNG